jgi:primase-polymerase (primpol)-like protein
MPDASLPEAFRDLEQWSAWALETEKERSDKRQASTLEDLKAFV